MSFSAGQTSRPDSLALHRHRNQATTTTTYAYLGGLPGDLGLLTGIHFGGLLSLGVCGIELFNSPAAIDGVRLQGLLRMLVSGQRNGAKFAGRYDDVR